MCNKAQGFYQSNAGKIAMDKGPWEVHYSEGKPVGILSDDFNHDVLLIIDGDFAEGEKEKYAKWLTDTLNTRSPQEGE